MWKDKRFKFSLVSCFVWMKEAEHKKMLRTWAKAKAIQKCAIWTFFMFFFRLSSNLSSPNLMPHSNSIYAIFRLVEAVKKFHFGRLKLKLSLLSLPCDKHFNRIIISFSYALALSHSNWIFTCKCIIVNCSKRNILNFFSLPRVLLEPANSTPVSIK